ncbi:hypothetical protein ACVIGB_000103 [Bradyrhizobium sp. USDA 4341]
MSKSFPPRVEAVASADEAPARRRRRSTAVKRKVMPKSFIGNFLDGPRPKFASQIRTNAEISRYLLELSLEDLGGKPITGPSPEGDDRIARTMAMEVIAAIQRDGHAEAQHWYTSSLKKAEAIIGLMHPEIIDDAAAVRSKAAGFTSARDAHLVMVAAMAITSQSVTVRDNARFAKKQFEHYVKHGRFDTTVVMGTKALSIQRNLQKFNQLVEVFQHDYAALRTFLTTEFTMAEVAAAAAASGMRISGGEMVDEPVVGGIVFGPKIGNSFLANLLGIYSSLTIDLWYTRTFGRYTGTLMKDSVTSDQVDRLSSSLARDNNIAAALRRQDAWIDPDDLGVLENDDLLAYARKVQRTWEEVRSSLVEQGSDNASISRRKAELEWPNAAESIIKSLGAPVDAPGSKSKRRWMRQVTNRALRILDLHGYKMSICELQALLWVPEKQLWLTLSGKSTKLNLISYDDAFAAIARKQGITDDAIQQAIHSVGARRLGGSADPGSDLASDPAAVRDLHLDTPPDRRRKEEGRGRRKSVVSDPIIPIPVSEDDQPSSSFAM